MSNKYDFSGYVTKNDLLCSDGRTIRKDAFADCDGKRVPLVWHHMHDDPSMVLGYVELVNKPNGVYGYGYFNDSEKATSAKQAVAHGDVVGLSIYANQLKENGGDVLHGNIREVSLVLAGANPGATIDNVSIQHSDGWTYDVEDEAVIRMVGDSDMLFHADEDKSDETIGDVLNSLNDKQASAVAYLLSIATGEDEPDDESDDEGIAHADHEETVQDVLNTLSDKQKAVVDMLLDRIVSGEDDSEDEDESDEMAQSGMEYDMGRNVFDGTTGYNAISHDDMVEIVNEAKRVGSFREAFQALDEGTRNAFLMHTTYTGGDGATYTARDYGISNIGLLFPEAHMIGDRPGWVKRRTEWVNTVLGGVHKVPYSRIRTMNADITADEARARGYITGNKKVEEVFSVLKRETLPTTVYKLQKFNRDEILDVTDFDVVSWVRDEMRVMLDEEIARACLIGDGRSAASNDKINESCIRPIWTDDSLYALNLAMNSTVGYSDMVDEILVALDDYEGTGTPTMFMSPTVHTQLKILRDEIGNRLYRTDDELASAMGVSKIVDVPVMKNLYRTVGTGASAYTADLIGIVVNLTDYAVGTDKGGEVNAFDDFDIDYNQMKYLIETRMSGALTLPKSALVIEKKRS